MIKDHKDRITKIARLLDSYITSNDLTIVEVARDMKINEITLRRFIYGHYNTHNRIIALIENYLDKKNEKNFQVEYFLEN